MKVIVSNYQSVSRVAIELRGFTIIVGDSNIGKSSLVRSIVGAFANSLDAGAVRKGKSSAQVEIEHKGHKIFVERSESTTAYIVDGQKYLKLNRQPCPAVENMGFRAVQIGDFKLTPQWIADQFFPLFILDATPSTAAGMVTQATRLDVISRASKLGATELKQKKTLLKTREADLKTAGDRLALYVDVPGMVEKAKGVKLGFLSLKKQEQDVQQLKGYSSEIEKLKQQDSVLQAVSSITVPDRDLGLVDTLQHLHQISEQLEESKAEEGALSGLTDLKVLEVPDFVAAMAGIDRLKEIKVSLAEGMKKEETFRLAREDLVSLEEALDKEQAELWVTLGSCPLCDSKLVVK